MALFKTEVTSETLASDNPIHQRLLKPYLYVEDKIGGFVAEIGCGDGRGLELLAPRSEGYTALDKSTAIAQGRARGMKGVEFIETMMPPIPLPDNTYDVVLCFQVIEHILNDTTFLEELHRILKPGGTLYLTTPNRTLSLSRNPWHIREYAADELTLLAAAIFGPKGVQMLGITGNEKVMRYYEENKQSVKRLTRWDILDLQHRLPASLLKVPYEIMNRLNRSLLRTRNQGLVQELSHEDYLISQQPAQSLDLFLVARK
ncbi:class I SAM-dependent methyltransferase [Cesiribacter andamanensis]|uniref:Putative S-adenosylmethionine-dependent methyltransferase n=1 Tax=Cesiribacter andamanensis AMV16 TaxID=1279009 RepID=M7N6Q9_9BACT|nr:class I SAM-dependent methyltransferase [Cesiribacter andamanensis]EMR04273.1 putative S-adenosylmethionine-dependent methyltransferase [Cesiribacter andamanensis AMV16]